MSLFRSIRSLYHWINTPYPNPNTGNQAFDWFQELPPANVFTPGLVPHRQFFNVMQPQVMSTDTQLVSGLGGLQAGQLLSQSLVMPPNPNDNNTTETG